MTLTIRHLFLAGVAVGLSTITGFGPARPQEIVFDPNAVAQAVQQVKQGVSQIATLQAQLQSQSRMIQGSGSDVTGPLRQILQAATALLQQSQGLGYFSTNLSSTLASAYPTSLQGQSLAQITSLSNAWTAASRQTIQEAMQTQNQIALAMPTTATAVAGAVTAAKSAAGQTSAIQSVSQLLSAVSTQLGQLQTLLMTQERQVQTLELQQQALSTKAQTDSATAMAHQNTSPYFSRDTL